jgi:predicted ABC-type ATPase
MYVLAGPNGAGKSTLYDIRIRPHTNAPFINADDILRERQAAGAALDAYRAAALAAEIRDQHLAAGQSFVTETVFSHPSKLALLRTAKAAGFRIVLFHVNVESADIAVARVRWRVSQGGHDVPEDKIRARYERNPQYIREAAGLADIAQIYDSSKEAVPPRWVLTFHDGQLYSASNDVPQWTHLLYGV